MHLEENLPEDLHRPSGMFSVLELVLVPGYSAILTMIRLEFEQVQNMKVLDLDILCIVSKFQLNRTVGSKVMTILQKLVRSRQPTGKTYR